MSPTQLTPRQFVGLIQRLLPPLIVFSNYRNKRGNPKILNRTSRLQAVELRDRITKFYKSFNYRNNVPTKRVAPSKIITQNEVYAYLQKDCKWPY